MVGEQKINSFNETGALMFMCNTVHKEAPYPVVQLFEDYIHFYLMLFNIPSIAQLVERRTVVVHLSDILRSLVRLRLEGVFLQTFFFLQLFLVHNIICKQLVIVIIQLMLSVCICPKVITLSSFHCIIHFF